MIRTTLITLITRPISCTIRIQGRFTKNRQPLCPGGGGSSLPTDNGFESKPEFPDQGITRKAARGQLPPRGFLYQRSVAKAPQESSSLRALPVRPAARSSSHISSLFCSPRISLLNAATANFLSRRVPAKTSMG